jgi:hypothetical protein
MSSKYEKMNDGEAYRFDKRTTLRFACCDCGMVHEFRFAETKKYMYFMATQIPRATAQLRRKEYGNLHKGVRNWKITKKL